MIDWTLIQDLVVWISILVTVFLSLMVVALLFCALGDLMMMSHARRVSCQTPATCKKGQAVIATQIASYKQSARQLLAICVLSPFLIAVWAIPWILRAMGVL